jgi:hypothetical protein
MPSWWQTMQQWLPLMRLMRYFLRHLRSSSSAWRRGASITPLETCLAVKQGGAPYVIPKLRRSIDRHEPWATICPRKVMKMLSFHGTKHLIYV